MEDLKKALNAERKANVQLRAELDLATARANRAEDRYEKCHSDWSHKHSMQFERAERLLERTQKAEAALDVAREYGESTFAHDIACMTKARKYEADGDLGTNGLGGFLEFSLAPPIPPPWIDLEGAMLLMATEEDRETLRAVKETLGPMLPTRSQKIGQEKNRERIVKKQQRSRGKST